MKGQIIRRRIQWIEEGEKPSKFIFYESGKNRSINNTIYYLNVNNKNFLVQKKY